MRLRAEKRPGAVRREGNEVRRGKKMGPGPQLPKRDTCFRAEPSHGIVNAIVSCDRVADCLTGSREHQPYAWRMTMRTRKPFVLVSSLLALIAVGGGLLVWRLPTLKRPRNRTRAPGPRCRLRGSRRGYLFTTGEQGRASADSIENFQRYLTTQIALIKSQLVLNAALGIAEFSTAFDQEPDRSHSLAPGEPG